MTFYFPPGPDWERGVRIRAKVKRSHPRKPPACSWYQENFAPNTREVLPIFECACGFKWRLGDPIPNQKQAPPRKSRRR